MGSSTGRKEETPAHGRERTQVFRGARLLEVQICGVPTKPLIEVDIPADGTLVVRYLEQLDKHTAFS